MSAADLVHGPLGPDEIVAADAVGRGLGPDAVADQVGDFVVAAAAAEECAGVPLGGREQAVADLALGREPQAVAVAAERLRHGLDEADAAAAVGVLEIGRRLAGVRRRDRHERAELGFEDAADRRRRRARRPTCQCCSASSGMYSMNRSSRPRSRAKRASGTISSSVSAVDGDRVEADLLEAGLLCGGDAGQHAVEARRGGRSSGTFPR